jgi:tetratricopeptide (TPR) repeat protein
MAIAGYKRLVDLVATDQPRPVGDMATLGNLYISIGEPENAIPHFQDVLRTGGKNMLAMAANYNIAHALSLLGRVAEARSYFEAAIDIFEESQTQVLGPTSRANVAQAMGQAHSALGLTDKGRELYVTAIQLAEGLGKTPIFSSISYREISAAEFADETKRLLEQLDQVRR